MKIVRVQYDGEGQWLDIGFDDGKSARLPVGAVRNLAEELAVHEVREEWQKYRWEKKT